MIRTLHRWPGLVAAVLLVLLALSGSVLSVFPALDRIGAPSAVSGQSVADLVAVVRTAHPGVEQIKRAPSGKITAYWFTDGTPGAAVIDPITGLEAASADPNPVERWLTQFHRSLFLDDTGRLVMAGAAAALLALSISGAMLMAQRVGGWQRWFSRLRGPLAGRLHSELARVAVVALALSAVTALWMTASTFGMLPDDAANPAVPSQVSGQTGMDPSGMDTLRTTPVAALRELTFPYPDDATDVFTLTTDHGTGYLDQGTGALLVWETPGPWAQIEEWIYLLHTGKGAAVWGLVLGLMVLSVPVLAVTGTLMWVKSRGGQPRLRGMVAVHKAETVILVGSEGGTTWGFATTLARALQDAGQAVHMAPMSAFAPARYSSVRRIVLMAATWGDGTAPSSAKGFLDRLATDAALPKVPMAILGFGDNSFPAFCAYADTVETAAREKGWSLVLPTDRINRQSPQDFARWSRDFGQAIGEALDLTHQPAPPVSTALTLISRRDYGESVQAPAAILRFALPKVGLWQRVTGRGISRFQAGDLLGILPEGSTVPRFYSLASGADDGIVEIVVRKHPGGLCSSQLMALQQGQTVTAFLRRNPEFHPSRDKAPLILIGAGTGIGPLAGFVRANAKRRPIHLWFGARHPQGDLFYGEELADWSQDGRLAGLRTAFSRTAARQYVQDALRADGEVLRDLVANGARIMVCGGRDMAQGVRDALLDILTPVGLTPTLLKAQGRYAEDTY
ncbi:MAG: PepSY domain-containing protein [Paracoccaceae bacterium]